MMINSGRPVRRELYQVIVAAPKHATPRHVPMRGLNFPAIDLKWGRGRCTVRHARRRGGALCGLCNWSVPAAAQSAEEEVAKQTARLISDAIAKRVGDDVDVIYAARAPKAW
jgi:hypothetical protein